MNMTMKNGLPRALAVIYPDVKTRDRSVLKLAVAFCRLQELVTGIYLRLPELEIGRNMAFGNNIRG